MPTLSVAPGRAERAEDLEDLGARVGLEREPDMNGSPVRASAAWSARAFSANRVRS